MAFIDLNITENSLLEKQKQLGFNAIYCPKIVVLSHSKDLKLVSNGFAVEAKDSEVLRAAAKKKVLINPLLVKGFARDDGLIRAVADGKALFEIPLFYILNSEGIKRAELIKHITQFLKKCIKLNARFCFTSRSKTVYDLKSPHEIIAIGKAMGLTQDQAKAAMSLYPETWLGE